MGTLATHSHCKRINIAAIESASSTSVPRFFDNSSRLACGTAPRSSRVWAESCIGQADTHGLANTSEASVPAIGVATIS